MALKINRMVIDDVGSDPIKLATAIVDQLPKNSKPVPVREIASAIDIYEIREEQLDNFEGGLITPDDKSDGMILVNKNNSERRKRYTIAHEIGHYVNPSHKPQNEMGFKCNIQDMQVDNHKMASRAKRMEVEANIFAAELLMPSAWIDEFLRTKQGAEISHILNISKEFDVSREAATRRYVSRIEEPIAAIFSHRKKIRYFVRNNEFPYLAIMPGQALPAGSTSNALRKNSGTITNWQITDNTVWTNSKSIFDIYEQTIFQDKEYRITLLSAEYGEENTEDYWDPPQFRR